MIWVNVVSEGQSEMAFVRKTLNKYFNGSLLFYSRRVMTSRDNRTDWEYRGGLNKYSHVKRDIETWLKSEPDAYLTTRFDFSGYENAMRRSSDDEAVTVLENALKEDIPTYRKTALSPISNCMNLKPCYTRISGS